METAALYIQKVGVVLSSHVIVSDARKAPLPKGWGMGVN